MQKNKSINSGFERRNLETATDGQTYVSNIMNKKSQIEHI